MQCTHTIRVPLPVHFVNRLCCAPAPAACTQDNSSFIHIPYSNDNTTEVFALTLIGAPCGPLGGNSSTQPLQQTVTGAGRAVWGRVC